MTARVFDEFSVGWNDAQLIGMRWESAGRDFVIQASFISSDGRSMRTRELLCLWARALSVSLEFGEKEAGFPMVSEMDIRRLSDTAFRVEILFGSTGAISLQCYQLQWITETQMTGSRK